MYRCDGALEPHSDGTLYAHQGVLQSFPYSGAQTYAFDRTQAPHSVGTQLGCSDGMQAFQSSRLQTYPSDGTQAPLSGEGNHSVFMGLRQLISTSRRLQFSTSCELLAAANHRHLIPTKRKDGTTPDPGCIIPANRSRLISAICSGSLALCGDTRKKRDHLFEDNDTTTTSVFNKAYNSNGSHESHSSQSQECFSSGSLTSPMGEYQNRRRGYEADDATTLTDRNSQAWLVEQLTGNENFVEQVAAFQDLLDFLVEPDHPDEVIPSF